MGKVGSSSTSGYNDTSNLQNILGIAAVGGGLYKNLGGNWLNNFGASNNNLGYDTWTIPITPP
jgi:hypothetical protein